jgi:hypothetical protein
MFSYQSFNVVRGFHIMETLNALCIKNWSITADNGDYFEVERGKFYTTSLPGQACAAHGPDPVADHVTVFSNYWVSVPAECFSFDETAN